MPGRPARSNRSSAATVKRKSSTTTLRTRGSASARNSAYAAEIPDEGPETSLRTQITQVFGDAQKSIATHRKLVVTLRKIQEVCCYELPEAKKKQQTEHFDISDFNAEVERCVLRLLPVKKSEPVADKVTRFFGVFLGYAVEKDNAIFSEMEAEDAEELVTPTVQLASQILNTLLGTLTSKDKVVRFRATQIISAILSNIGQLPEELYQLVLVCLSKRLQDKETSIRTQAVLSVGPYALDEEETEDDEDDDAAANLMLKLLHIMQSDPSGEVRKTVLMNISMNPKTLKYLLERARDVDAPTRRALYGKLLPALGDFRHMSMAERAKLLRWGLKDRDDGVRKAMGRTFRERWIEDCAAAYNPIPEDQRKPGDVAPPSMEALMELLERISVIETGVIDDETGEPGIAHIAMREFWDGRPDYREDLVFDDDFWNQLSAESAFVARSFNDYCSNFEDSRMLDLLENKMPTATRFSYFLADHLNRLVKGIALLAGDEGESSQGRELEEACEQQEFVVQQLLSIALTLDYSDEHGRRQMFSLSRESLQRPELPERCTKLAVELLRITCGSREQGEREFCAVIYESITEVRDSLSPVTEKDDNVEEEESFHSAQSDISDTIQVHPRKGQPIEELTPEAQEEQRFRQMLVYLKCLHIAECALKEVYCPVPDEENNPLTMMFNKLIIPAIRSHELAIREAGLRGLTLCCILTKNLAEQNLALVAYILNNPASSESLRLLAINSLSDILAQWPSLLAPVTVNPDTTTSSDVMTKENPWLDKITKIFLEGFLSDEQEMRVTSCVAVMPLLMRNVLSPSHAITVKKKSLNIIREFVIAYFDPETKETPALGQALTYFLPVFCHSRQANTMVMVELTRSIISKLMTERDKPDDDTAEQMVAWPVIAGHLAEWTDGRRVLGATEVGLDGKTNLKKGAEEPHIMLATKLLERALKDSCTKDERKILLMLLTKLHISSSRPTSGETVDADMLNNLHDLASEAVEENLGIDATSRNYISKLQIGLAKRLGDVERVTQTPDVEGQAEDDEEDTQAGAQMEIPVPIRSKGKAVAEPEEEGEGEEEEEEDTLMAGVQAEGTRMPLEAGEDEEDDDTTEVPVRQVVTESDIVDSLLNSEVDG
ncbi:hypothetical protein K491DRAFT_784605 [Lophiostoma macrostomum CBS 122681]|uniref:Nuclear condensin complex subunit 3 C-terminal domain-containing protein n=1 Tax=Lophiostoma macrostomum CBS 122681 TaxID=1314788 RepID=A0A6A6SIE3_9PLEO|nr:hypothetical protein K491DRAFT_784605 [Lophiostoma macrostomum CBS 122681]